MVIGDTFAWGHMPKTAGDATLAMFSTVGRVMTHSDAAETNEKHALFRERPELVEGKELFLNFRRLPTWLLSYHQHVCRHGVFPDYRPQPMSSPRAMAESSIADTHLSWFTDDGRLGIGYWIRMEYLVRDFIAAVSRHTELSQSERTQIESVGAVNSLDYEHELQAWFSPSQVLRMYEVNPWWATIEQRIYGNLLAQPCA